MHEIFTNLPFTVYYCDWFIRMTLKYLHITRDSSILTFFCRTESEWSRSLIVKRVAFEAFDCFLPLFYIAFYQLDVVNLRRELLGLFGGKLLTNGLVILDHSLNRTRHSFNPNHLQRRGVLIVCLVMHFFRQLTVL